MREELLGYVLGALEPNEQRALEARLATDADLRRELSELRRLFQAGPGEGYELVDPPADLARRTISTVDAIRYCPPPPVPELPAADDSRRWNRFDAVTLIGIAMAAGVILIPLLSAGRYQAQATACRQRLHEVGLRLIDYSRQHGRHFPEVAEFGPGAHAGVFAVRLHEAGYLPDSTLVFCPAALDDEIDSPELPSWTELLKADDAEVEGRFASLNGLYGYTLGHIENDRYHSPRNHDRGHFAVLGDTPFGGDRRRSGHGCGQNVWFEDGHAEFLNACRLHLGNDDIYENHHGQVGAGIGKDDVVIGAATSSPRITPEKAAH